MRPEPSISINEARKKLGKKYRDLSDDQIEDLVLKLELIAKATVQDLGSKII